MPQCVPSPPRDQSEDYGHPDVENYAPPRPIEHLGGSTAPLGHGVARFDLPTRDRGLPEVG